LKIEGLSRARPDNPHGKPDGHRHARRPEPIVLGSPSCRAVEFFSRVAKFRRARAATRCVASLLL